MFVEVEQMPDGTWIKSHDLPSYIPYSQWGIVKIQPNGDRREGLDLRPLWGIRELQGQEPASFRMLGYSLPSCLWEIFVHFLGKKWPDER